MSPRYSVVAFRAAVGHVDDSKAEFFAVTPVVQFVLVTLFEIMANFNRLHDEH